MKTKTIFILAALGLLILIIFGVRVMLNNPEYSGGYKIIDGHVYYEFPLSGAGIMESIELKEADLESFRAINSIYAEDKNHKYLKGMKIPGKIGAKMDAFEENLTIKDTTKNAASPND